MNKVILMGRLTKDPEVRYSQGVSANQIVARYTLAVDRRFSKENEADFINCVVFGKSAEFSEKYFRKGTNVLIEGRIQTGSYTNQKGEKIYTTDIVVESQEFAESKKQGEEQPRPNMTVSADGFMNIPDNIDEELPFN